MMSRGTAVVAALLMLFGAGSVGAQERIAVVTEPGTPVVATEILIAVGPAQEEAGQSGIAYLAARSVLAQVQERLDSIGVVASATPHKDAVTVSVIAAPDVWEFATNAVLVALFRDPPESASMLRERGTIAADLRGRLANPADAATRAMDQAFFGATHAWGRPEVGTPESIGRLTFAQVDVFLRDHFLAERAYIAVVGPVDEDEARSHLRPLVGSVSPAPLAVSPFRPSARPVRRDYDSITTWVGASYLLPQEGDMEALAFLAYLAEESLSFSPTQRSVYDVWSDVAPRPHGGELRLQVVVPPQEEDDWAERVESAIPDIAARTMPEDEFLNHLRRFRGLHLSRLVAPEDRAREVARQLFVHGRVYELAPDIGAITQERVRAAARSLPDPIIVLLGPTLDDD